MLEAAYELGAIEWLAALGVTEDEVSRVAVVGAGVELLERVGDAACHRDGAAGACGLGVGELAADVGGDDADAACVEVDVSPPEGRAARLGAVQSSQR